MFKTFCSASLFSSAVSSFLHNHTEAGRIVIAIPFHRWGTLSPKRGQTKSHPCWGRGGAQHSPPVCNTGYRKSGRGPLVPPPVEEPTLLSMKCTTWASYPGPTPTDRSWGQTTLEHWSSVLCLLLSSFPSQSLCSSELQLARVSSVWLWLWLQPDLTP